MKKILQHNIGKILYVFCIFMLSMSAVNAQDITGKGIYILKEGEMKSDGEAAALIRASNDAAEKTMIYIRTYTQTKNYQLTDKELIQINSYALKIKNSSYKWDFSEGKTVICTATFEFDDDLEKYITSIKENTQLKNQNQQLASENNTLHQNYTLNYRTTNPDAINAYKEGQMCVEEGMHEEASQHFLKAITIDNKDVVLQEAYYESLLNCLKIGVCKKALDDFVKVQPDYAKNANYYYYYATGTLLNVIELEYVKGNFDNSNGAKNAMADFWRALNYNCDKPDIYAKMAVACTYNKSETNNTAKSYFPYSGYRGKWYYFALGRMYGRENNYRKAIANFEEAIRLDYSFVEAWYNCGYICFKQHDYNTARVYMQKGRSAGYRRGGEYKHHDYTGVFQR